MTSEGPAANNTSSLEMSGSLSVESAPQSVNRPTNAQASGPPRGQAPVPAARGPVPQQPQPRVPVAQIRPGMSQSQREFGYGQAQGGNMGDECGPMNSDDCCAAPIILRHKVNRPTSQCVHFTIPAVNVCCEIPAPKRRGAKPKTCYLPIVIHEEDADNEYPCEQIHIDLGQCGSNMQAEAPCGGGGVSRYRSGRRSCGPSPHRRGCGGAGMGGSGWGRY